MVNKERVKLLVDALRSGKYKQGFKVLTKEDCDCPAGVACKIAIENGLDVTVKILPDDKVVQYDESVHCLPESVKDWYGFRSQFIEVRLNDREIFVTELTDKHGYSFDQIANLIEHTFLSENEDVE